MSAEDLPTEDLPTDGGRRVFTVREMVSGAAEGPALVLHEPLSFWGGVDPTDGRIVDRHHPQHGEVVTGRVLVLPLGRGSSSGSSILTEMARLGTATSAIVLEEPDEILALGAIVADELYRTTIPVVVWSRADRVAVNSGDRIEIDGTALAVF